MTLKSHAKFEEKLTCGLENEEFDKFSSEHFKVSKLVFLWNCFVQSRKSISYNLQRMKMTLKNDQKFEDELTYRFKIAIKVLTNFDSRT